jgi:hypothetical protein
MKSPFSKISIRKAKTSNHRRCNICDRLFRASNSRLRFCKSCKASEEKEGELFRFHDWLPQT